MAGIVTLSETLVVSGGDAETSDRLFGTKTRLGLRKVTRVRDGIARVARTTRTERKERSRRERKRDEEIEPGERASIRVNICFIAIARAMV